MSAVEGLAMHPRTPYHRRYRRRRLSYFREYARKRRKLSRDLGLCSRCGKHDHETGYKCCRICLDYMNSRNAAKREVLGRRSQGGR